MKVMTWVFQKGDFISLQISFVYWVTIQSGLHDASSSHVGDMDINELVYTTEWFGRITYLVNILHKEKHNRERKEWTYKMESEW